MKYNITLNQPLMIENKLNVSQWCILDVISVAPIWCEAVQKDNEVYYWVARQKISEELKALDLKSDTIYRYIKQLVELGFINHIKDGKKDLIKLTQKGKSLFVSMSEKNPNHYVGKKSELNSEKNPTYNNTNLNNKTNNKYDIFLDYLKSKCKYKSKVTKTKEGKVLFNQIEDKRQLAIDYINHQEEKNEFAVRISKFMEDYNTVYKYKTNSSNTEEFLTVEYIHKQTKQQFKPYEDKQTKRQKAIAEAVEMFESKYGTSKNNDLEDVIDI